MQASAGGVPWYPLPCRTQPRQRHRPSRDKSVYFFFSSRSRHTGCSRDWSSDVCSSDLITSKALLRLPNDQRHLFNPSNLGITVTLLAFPSVGIAPPYHFTENLTGSWDWLLPGLKIGRASCRERV